MKTTNIEPAIARVVQLCRFFGSSNQSLVHKRLAAELKSGGYPAYRALIRKGTLSVFIPFMSISNDVSVGVNLDFFTNENNVSSMNAQICLQQVGSLIFWTSDNHLPHEFLTFSFNVSTAVEDFIENVSKLVQSKEKTIELIAELIDADTSKNVIGYSSKGVGVYEVFSFVYNGWNTAIVSDFLDQNNAVRIELDDEDCGNIEEIVSTIVG